MVIYDAVVGGDGGGVGNEESDGYGIVRRRKMALFSSIA